ncbi:Rv1733c family protein [Nocardia amikacinitolerans]|uniref:Rv1733c family protein n=1 Tax=Nocardia amikacinitolerans TaxID=756689 RepID=UPI0020A5B573|nr:hypothetical protein [Nocardia amikacinitolerans]MCP2293317.1 hypothetical protein [Nocardia amikacinitolerans]
MSGYPPLPVRLWHRRPWRASPLMRTSDRIQALAGIAAIAAMLLAVPLAGAAGTRGYAEAADRIRAEDAAKVSVSAVVVEQPRSKVLAGRYGHSSIGREAVVRWNRDGRTHSATVAVGAESAPGAEISIWLDRRGRPTTAPHTTDAVGAGIGAGLGLLLIVWGAAVIVIMATNALLDACRAAHWEREWRQIGRPLGQDS